MTDHTLKDLMVWREEEILATELLSQIVRGHGRFYIWPAATSDSTAETLVSLICRPYLKKAYLSFPMSHVMGMPDVLAEIDAFRREMKRAFHLLRPGRRGGEAACRWRRQAAEGGQPSRWRSARDGDPHRAGDGARSLDILADIDGQIYARDFKLIDQADMIVSLIPELPDGRPGLSSGVERELQHAHEATKDVFVIWRPQAPPSPFITETATRLFQLHRAGRAILPGQQLRAPPALRRPVRVISEFGFRIWELPRADP